MPHRRLNLLILNIFSQVSNYRYRNILHIIMLLHQDMHINTLLVRHILDALQAIEQLFLVQFPCNPYWNPLPYIIQYISTAGLFVLRVFINSKFVIRRFVCYFQ